jgi:hypothetical protein
VSRSRAKQADDVELYVLFGGRSNNEVGNRGVSCAGEIKTDCVVEFGDGTSGLLPCPQVTWGGGAMKRFLVLAGVALALVLPLAGTSDAQVPHRASSNDALPVITRFNDPSNWCQRVPICGDGFGTILGVNSTGTIAVLGSPDLVTTGAPWPEGGAAWVFEVEDGSWVEVAQLQADQDTAFGDAVAISNDGSTIAVASGWLNNLLGAVKCNPEEVEVFTEPAAGWSGVVAPATALTVGSDLPVYQSGYCGYGPFMGYVQPPLSYFNGYYLLPPDEWVAMSGDGSTIVTSIDGDWLYVEPQGGWGAEPQTAPTVALAPPTDPDLGDLGTGSAPVAISNDGSEVAVSTPMISSAFTGGAVSVYPRPGASWSGSPPLVQPSQVIVNPTPSDDPIAVSYDGVGPPVHWSTFGLYTMAFSADGTTLVISDMTRCTVPATYPMCDNASGGYDPRVGGWQTWGPGPDNSAGGADVFQLDGGVWNLTGDLMSSDASEEDMAGWSLAISPDGTQVMLGAPQRMEIGTIGYGSGAAFLWTLGANGTWSEANIISPATPNDPGDLGYTVSFINGGAEALIGDPYFGARAGQTYEGDAARGEDAICRTCRAVTSVMPDRGGVYKVRIDGLPRVDSVTPREASPGEVVRVSGTGMGNASFYFDGARVTPLFRSSTKMMFRLPETAFTDTLTIRSAGAPLGGGVGIKVRGPRITRFSRNPARPGEKLVLFGTNLTSVISISFLSSNSAATIISEASTRIVILVPATAKTSQLIVYTRSGQIETATLDIK